jgi:diguanylate cyclase (GGDEF)-like protein
MNTELKRANRFDSSLAIVMADLDLLRNINNTYGHLAGDEVLIGIARILKQSVREYDVVARFGGEEFAILLAETTLEQAFKRAELIRKAVESASFPIPTSITPIKATLSLGIACRERFDQPGQEIVHNADTALYKSKLKGRNQVFAFARNVFYKMNAQEQAVVYQDQGMPSNELPVSPPVADSAQYLASETHFVAPVEYFYSGAIALR